MITPVMPGVSPYLRVGSATSAALPIGASMMTRSASRPGAIEDARDEDRVVVKRGVKIDVPTRILWGQHGNLSSSPAMDIWTIRCSNAEGAEDPCGHYLPEEAPEVVLDHMLHFADKCFSD